MKQKEVAAERESKQKSQKPHIKKKTYLPHQGSKNTEKQTLCSHFSCKRWIQRTHKMKKPLAVLLHMKMNKTKQS